ncbi:MAG TPA: hypothetical protein VFD92_02840 [Candidatus Binatia bacterium]|nr:hypothetical protein [Candidatus Binatia bacterium]
MARGLDSSVAPFPASARRSASRSGALAFALVVAATALLLAPGRASAQRQSGIQQGFEDEFTVLVSKDLGDQRWSIHYDGFVASGIVYPQAGGAPQFVWCENVSEEDPADPILFDCWGAGPCTGGDTCGDNAWTQIGQSLPIPASFFQLPDGAPSAASIRPPRPPHERSRG